MEETEILQGKSILIVDDEKDVLDALAGLLDMCKIDTASSFDEGGSLLEKETYDLAILDIMGVKGLELLKIANERGIPSLMLTAHGLSEENLMKSAEGGAAYYAPKDEMAEVTLFAADVLKSVEENKNPWVRWFERLGGYYDKRFHGKDWREKRRKFWEEKLKDFPAI